MCLLASSFSIPYHSTSCLTCLPASSFSIPQIYFLPDLFNLSNPPSTFIFPVFFYPSSFSAAPFLFLGFRLPHDFKLQKTPELKLWPTYEGEHEGCVWVPGWLHSLYFPIPFIYLQILFFLRLDNNSSVYMCCIFIVQLCLQICLNIYPQSMGGRERTDRIYPFDLCTWHGKIGWQRMRTAGKSMLQYCQDYWCHSELTM